MLQVGDKLPDLSAPNQDGEIIYLKQFIGQKLVVFFYPKANTSGCTLEVNSLNDNFSQFAQQGYQIIGVSADSVAQQKKFHDNNHLQFNLLADETKTIITAFGVWGKKKMYGREYEGIYRTTFLFDEKGICTEVIEKVKTKEAASQILK